MSNFNITVTDADGKTLLAAEGPQRVLFYLAQVAVETLEEIGKKDPDADATVSIYQGDTRHLNVTIDADSAAGLIKNRVNKLRVALKAAENGTAAG